MGAFLDLMNRVVDSIGFKNFSTWLKLGARKVRIGMQSLGGTPVEFFSSGFSS